MMVLQWCVDIFNVIVEVWFGYWLFNVPKYRRFEQKWVRVLEYGCFIGLPGFNIFYNRLMGIRYSNTQIFTLAFFFILSALIYSRRTIWYSLVWAGIFFNTISLLELPGIVLSGWLINKPYLYCVTQPIIYDLIYLLLLSFLLLLICFRYGCIIRKQLENIITLKNTLLWLIASMIEWWVITYFLIIGHTQSGRDVFMYNIISIVLILVLLAGLSVFIIYRRTEVLRQEHLLEEERRERMYDKIKEDYQRKSLELHDMKHRIQPIEAYLTLGQNNKALNYVKELLGDITQSQKRIHGWTGNPLIDSLLDYKADTALNRDIDFHIHVSLLNDFLSDKDTSVLLGNLLDNAIEAAAQCISKKWIDVYIIQKGNMLIIQVKNTFSRFPIEKQGKFQTTKVDKSGHGWGLESVRTIVESNGGELEIKYDDKYFEVSIIFLQMQEVHHGKRY